MVEAEKLAALIQAAGATTQEAPDWGVHCGPSFDGPLQKELKIHGGEVSDQSFTISCIFDRGTALRRLYSGTLHQGREIETCEGFSTKRGISFLRIPDWSCFFPDM